jgi:hypothetical protein
MLVGRGGAESPDSNPGAELKTPGVRVSDRDGSWGDADEQSSSANFCLPITSSDTMVTPKTVMVRHFRPRIRTSLSRPRNLHFNEPNLPCFIRPVNINPLFAGPYLGLIDQ